MGFCMDQAWLEWIWPNLMQFIRRTLHIHFVASQLGIEPAQSGQVARGVHFNGHSLMPLIFNTFCCWKLYSYEKQHFVCLLICPLQCWNHFLQFYSLCCFLPPIFLFSLSCCMYNLPIILFSVCSGSSHQLCPL